MKISELIRQDKEYRDFSQCLEETYRKPQPLPIVVNGLSGGASTAFLIEGLRDALRISQMPVLILVGDERERADMCSLLTLAGLDAVEYKPRDFVFHNISASHDVDRERLSVLNSIRLGERKVIVSTPAAAMSYTMPREILEESSLSVSLGDEISPDEITRKLAAMGYSAVENVESKGQFAKRGGIVDFFGADMDSPCRIDFFGDEVDRIVSFDPITQRSLNNLSNISLLPAKEVNPDAEARERILREIIKAMRSDKISDEIYQRLEREKAAVESGLDLAFADKYINLIYENNTCLFDYLNNEKTPIVFVNDTNACLENAKKYADRIDSDLTAMLSSGSFAMKVARYNQPFSDFCQTIEDGMTVHVNAFAGTRSGMKLSGIFGFRSRRTISYGGDGNFKMLIEDLYGFMKGQYRIVIFSESKAGAESLADALNTENLRSVIIPELSEFDFSTALAGVIYISVGDIEGFDLIGPRIAVISMARDSGKAVMSHKKRQSAIRRAGGSTKRIMSYAELAVGDYVVHAKYGIGLFEGMSAETVNGVTKDYITIRYAGTDKLYVPCDNLEMIGKYIGDRDKNGNVKLSVMGGGEWMRQKSRTKAAVKDIAKNLIEIYAERKRTPGFAFPANSELEDEFESEFSYEETESQLVAIKEIKEDMMRPVPMNRLLCGDVGFGKTEVALRAAFKAILGGKQVAILVPTTILALQHYQTAISRMRGYAVSIEMVSRFKKPKERASILERTKQGSVDLLIGTHSILSKKVEFRDLGLLIIDEEQRFGVMQKEKLREMAKNVDTLMLSATPIPRTLNMSLSGINDISVLDEAPGERRPVQTYVLEHDDEIIVDALRRELNRGGQSLYLYNKVDDIMLVADKIANALPEARVTYAHGQMDKEQLEDIWQLLVRGEIDILVCTTIIETGVDLPNANTLVIENSDRFGLSQLHQIRGRVGRSERQAYAYFTYRRGKSLTEVAEKRLEAIREFAEFGAGFKIALRDLEIRGAGNLLGAEQHGYIESVGYDLYMKMLNEAILEERGEAEKPKINAKIIINVSAHIPEYYIKSASQRMEMYKKISFIESTEDRADIYDELCDRFGTPPKPVERILNVSLARVLCERAMINKIEYSPGRIIFVSEKPDLGVWSELFAAHRQLSFVGIGSPIVVYRLRKDEDPTEVAAMVMSEYVKAMQTEENG